MSKHEAVAFENPEKCGDPIHELIRSGDRQLIQSAVESEFQSLPESCRARRTANGCQAAVRNGYLPERALQTGIGPVAVRIPKVRSRTAQRVVFRSSLVPPHVCKTRSLEAALPWLYLKGLSSGEMSEALQVLVGESACGLSASTVSRLKSGWSRECRDWQHRCIRGQTASAATRG